MFKRLKSWESFAGIVSLVKNIAWFFTAVFVPLTIYLVVIRKDVSAQAQDIAELKKADIVLNDIVSTKLDMIQNQLGGIREEIGGVKGELRRIKR